MRQTTVRLITAGTLFVGAVRASAQTPAPEQPAGIVDRTVQVGARQVHYLRAGSGPTTIVLLHGWPQSSYEWRRVMPLLADRFTVVAPDLPGIGGSSGPAGGASAPTAAFEKAALARDLHSFVATLGARRVVLAGHDVGGMVAYAYARLYPRELAGVAILDVPLPGVAPWDAIRASGHAWHFQFHEQHPLAETLVAGRQAAYFRYFINSNAANPSAIPDADVAAFARAYESPASLHAGFGFYRAFAADGQFNRAHAEPLDVPVLLAGADRSMGSGEAEMERGLRALGVRDIRVAVIPNSGHWIAEENPQATATVIAGFAAGVR